MSRPLELIDKKALREVVPYCPQHIARMEKAGKFPKRIKLGQNRVAWLRSEVDAWIEERLRERDVLTDCG